MNKEILTTQHKPAAWRPTPAMTLPVQPSAPAVPGRLDARQRKTRLSASPKYLRALRAAEMAARRSPQRTPAPPTRAVGSANPLPRLRSSEARLETAGLAILAGAALIGLIRAAVVNADFAQNFAGLMEWVRRALS